MLWLIIRKEIIGHVLTLRFAAAFILLLVLVFCGIYVSVNEYKQNMDEYHARKSAHDADLKGIVKEGDERTRRNKLFFRDGKSDAVPVSSLSWLGQGLQPSCPASINTKSNRESKATDVGMMRNPLRGLLRIPDFVYIVNVVVSFLAMLFMFDAVCGEKEAGTLRLMLSNAVPRHDVLMGKWIGGYVVLIVPFLVATAGGLLFARARGVFRPEDTGRVAVVVGLACLYVGVFFNAGLFISTVTRRSSTSLLVCLLLWVFSILVIPNLAPLTAKILEPTPPIETIRVEKRAVDQDINLRKHRVVLTTGEYTVGASVEEAWDNLERERNRRKNVWDQYYKDSHSRQMGLAATFGRLSPSACWTYAALALTRTGPAAYEALDTARKELLSEMGRMQVEFAKRRRTGEEEWAKFKFEDVPRLHVKHASTAEVLKSALNDILILVIAGVLFFMLSFMMFLRYDVR